MGIVRNVVFLNVSRDKGKTDRRAFRAVTTKLETQFERSYLCDRVVTAHSYNLSLSVWVVIFSSELL